MFLLFSKVDGKDLYTEVLSKGVPFFEWANWIEKRFEKEWFDFMYRKNKRLTTNIASRIPGAVILIFM